MAWSFVASYTSTANKTAGTADTATVTADVGDTLIIAAACDNISGGGAIGTTAITDASSNTYTRQTLTEGTGTAGGNLALASFTAEIGTALSAATVTFTPDSTVDAKAFLVWRFTGGPISTVGSTSSAGNDPGTSWSRDFTSAAADRLCVGLIGFETDAPSPVWDSDTTNGSWSTAVTSGTTGAAAASNITVGSQYKITTAAGTQTWDGTCASSGIRSSGVWGDPTVAGPPIATISNFTQTAIGFAAAIRS